MKLDSKRWATLEGKKFPMPTLYIYGNKEVTILPENLNHLQDCFDPIQVERLPAGHFVQEEKAQEVALLMNHLFQVPMAG